MNKIKLARAPMASGLCLEMNVGVTSFLFGFWLLLVRPESAGNHIFDRMREFVAPVSFGHPDILWGILFLLLGTAQIAARTTQNRGYQRACALLSGMVWLSMLLSFVFSVPANACTVLCLMVVYANYSLYIHLTRTNGLI